MSTDAVLYALEDRLLLLEQNLPHLVAESVIDPTRQRISETIREAATAIAIIRDGHAELTRLNIPDATGTACQDPTCNNTLVHRIRILAAGIRQ